VEKWNDGIMGRPKDSRMSNVKAQMPNQIRNPNDPNAESKKAYLNSSILGNHLKFGFCHLTFIGVCIGLMDVS
jgi:hypothetical protein